jgi:DNA-binding protein YbaB
MGFKLLRPAVILLGLVFTASFASLGQAASPSPSGDPFDKLKGNWKGGGSVILNDGTVKKVSCSVQYKAGGGNVTQTLNCKGNDYEVNTTLKVTGKDGKIKGSWNESVYAASGSVSGTAKGNLVHAVIAGDKFSGRMSIKLTDKGHTINVLQRDAKSGVYHLATSLSFTR